MALTLTDAERAFVACLEAGAECDLSERREASPSQLGVPIRGDVIRALVFGLALRDAAGAAVVAPIPLRGIRLKAAYIQGPLDLEDAIAEAGAALPPLLLSDCLIPEPVSLRHGRFRRLSFNGCRVTHIDAAGCVVDGTANFGGLSSAEEVAGLGLPLTGTRIVPGDDSQTWNKQGPEAGRCILDLSGANIGADLQLSASRMCAAPDGNFAIDLTDARIGSDLLARGLQCRGTLRLTGARVEAQGSLNAARLQGAGQRSLEAQSLHVGGGLFLRNYSATNAEGQPIGYPFLAHGEVMLDSATIVGNMDLSGAGLFGMGGYALIARSIHVKGASHFDAMDDEAFIARGQIDLTNGTFEGPVSFVGATISGHVRNEGVVAALMAQNISVHKALLITKGQLNMPDGTSKDAPFIAFGALDFNSSTFHDWLRILDIGLLDPPQPMLIYVNHARAQVLDDRNGDGWHPASHLVLDGFRYERFRDVSANVVQQRKAWLMQQFPRTQSWYRHLLPPGVRPLVGNTHRYASQPFEQAVKVLDDAGANSEARDLLSVKLNIERWVNLLRPSMPKNGALRRVRQLFAILWRLPVFFLGWLFKLGFDFGLSPGRALLTLLLCLGVGAAGTTLANGKRLGWEGPFDTPIGWFDPSISKLDPPVLTLDTAAVASVAVPSDAGPRPAITLSQANAAVDEIACGDAIDPFIYATDVFIPLIDLRQEDNCAITPGPAGQPWRWAKMVYAILGWIVSSLVILTVTGTLRRRAEAQ